MNVTTAGGTPHIEHPAFQYADDFTRLDANHPVAIRAVLDQASPPATISITLHGGGARAEGIAVTLTRAANNAVWVALPQTLTEYQGLLTAADLRAAGVLPDADESDSICVYDFAESRGSSFTDGDAVRSWGASHAFALRGHARSFLSEDKEGLFTPWNPVTGEYFFSTRSKFILSAGVERLTAEYVVGGQRLYGPDYGGVSRQAKVFYYSGHGFHDKREFAMIAQDDPSLSVDRVAAERAWSNGLELAVIAGCSLCDIVHAPGLPAAIDNRAPGEALITAGAPLLVGYFWRAPLDGALHHIDYTARIATRFLDSYVADRAASNLQSVPVDWFSANLTTMLSIRPDFEGTMDNVGRAYDACGTYAVRGEEANWAYWYVDWTTGRYTAVPRSNWP